MATRRSSYDSNLRTPRTRINIFEDNDEKTTEMIELLVAIDRLRKDQGTIGLYLVLLKRTKEWTTSMFIQLRGGYSRNIMNFYKVSPHYCRGVTTLNQIMAWHSHFLKKVKERLDSQSFYSFLRIFSEFGTKKKNIIARVEEISVIFAGHPDLMEGFIDFLPDAWNR